MRVSRVFLALMTGISYHFLYGISKVVYILLLLLIYVHKIHAIAIGPGLSKKISNCHGKCDECHTL